MGYVLICKREAHPTRRIGPFDSRKEAEEWGEEHAWPAYMFFVDDLESIETPDEALKDVEVKRTLVIPTLTKGSRE